MSLAQAQRYAEIVPLVRRVVDLDPSAVVRLREGAGRVSGLVRTPFGVLAARSVTAEPAEALDVTVRGDEFVAWADGERADAPAPRDELWHWGLPTQSGWRRVDVVPDEVVRGLVRSGALALKEAAEREGVPNAEPRAEVADALLDAVVLTVTGEGADRVEVPLRTLSALTRLGFAGRGSDVAIDLAGRWARVVGSFGTVYLETAPSGLSVLR